MKQDAPVHTSIPARVHTRIPATGFGTWLLTTAGAMKMPEPICMPTMIERQLIYVRDLWLGTVVVVIVSEDNGRRDSSFE